MSDTSDLLQTVLPVTLSCIFLKSRSVRYVVLSIFNRPLQHTIIVRTADRQTNIEEARTGDLEQTIARILAMKTVPSQHVPDDGRNSSEKRGRHRTTKRSGP